VISDWCCLRPARPWVALHGSWFSRAILQKHLAASLQRLIIGFRRHDARLIVGNSHRGLRSYARAGLGPLVSAFFTIPKLALLRRSSIILVSELAKAQKVATILFGCFLFPQSLATYGGIDNVDRT